VIAERAYAKVNLVLHSGPPREEDGLHPLCSLFASLELADELTVEECERDELDCRGVEGDNLATDALRAIRVALPGEIPPLRIRIDKRIPVAAGLGGGSADAAAVLRAANELAGSPLGPGELRGLAAGIGSDVPSQVQPGHALVTGVGEEVEPVDLPDFALVLVPAREGLHAGEVYAELDRLEGWTERLDPERLRGLAGRPLPALAEAVENDLQPAALSLRPELEGPLAALRESGAPAAALTGSGPTAFGLFVTDAEARTAAERIAGAIVTRARSGGAGG
jgi:4-diphosphocytidyl-2-C-methyl-D-erythritol kinase